MIKILIVVAISLVVAIVAATIARKHGRNPNLWFAVGFALNLLALPLLIMLVQRVRDRNTDSEN